MKTTPTNLNKARKEKSREGARRDADANSEKFGRTKAQKALQAARAEKLKAALDAHKRETPKDDA